MKLLPQRSEFSIFIVHCRFIMFAALHSHQVRNVGRRLPEAIALKTKIDDLGSKVRQLKSEKKSKVCTELHVVFLIKCNQLNARKLIRTFGYLWSNK